MSRFYRSYFNLFWLTECSSISFLRAGSAGSTRFLVLQHDEEYENLPTSV